MHLERSFEVACDRDRAVEVLARDATLVGLFPEAETEIVETRGRRKTARSRYRVLGREGTATFHFDFLPDGSIAFEKVCDGNVWRELRGEVQLEARDGGTRVRIAMDGSTRRFVPELTIKGPMTEQLDGMARALADLLEEVGE